PKRGHTRTKNVHRMRRRRQLLQHRPNGRRQSTPPAKLRLVSLQLSGIGKLAMNEQESNLFELTQLCEFQDVIPAVMQIVPTSADVRKTRVPAADRGQGDRFLRLDCSSWCRVAHDSGWSFDWANRASSFFS